MPHLGRRSVAIPLQNPLGIIQVFESQQRLSPLLDGVEGSHPQQVFLEQVDEALGATVSLRFTDETGRRLDAEEVAFPPEVVGQIAEP
jgi:hypothetical protein